MEKRDSFTRVLAILGTILIWLPLLAPLFFSLVRLFGQGVFNFDYLMPAELFPVVLAGGIQLIWAALRARSQRGLIIGGLGAGVALLIAGQGLAVVTGAASGETEPSAALMTLILGSIAAYALALIVAGTGGALLLRDLFKPSQTPA